MANKLTPEEIEQLEKIKKFLKEGVTGLSSPNPEDAPEALKSILEERKSPSLFEEEITSVSKPKEFEYTTQAGDIKKSSILPESLQPEQISSQSDITSPYTKQSEEALREKLEKTRKSKKALGPVRTAASSEANKEFIEKFGEGQPKIKDYSDLLKRRQTPLDIQAREGTEVDSKILQKLEDLSDDVLQKLGPIGEKVLQNKYVGKGIKLATEIAPKVVPALGLYEGYQGLKNVEQGKYYDASGNLMGAGSIAAGMLGAPATAGALGAGALTSAVMPSAVKAALPGTEEERIELAKKFAEALDKNKKLKSKLESQTGMRFTPPLDYKNLLEQSGLSDEEILRKTQEYNKAKERSELPSQRDVIEYTINNAKMRGLDPAFHAAQIGQESNYDPTAVSPTGRKGLGQMGLDAFIDAKLEDRDNSLGGIDSKILRSEGFDKYKDKLASEYQNIMSNPKNWKKQIDASLLYNQAIKNRYNKSGTEEEQLMRYHGGTEATEESIAKQYEDAGLAVPGVSPHKEYLNLIQDKKREIQNAIDAQKNDPDAFNKYLSKYNRNPASTQNLTENEKLISNVVGASSPEERDVAIGKVLKFGPFSDKNLYEKSLSNKDRLVGLWNQYQELKNAKEEPSTQLTEEEPTEIESEDQKTLPSDIENLFKTQKGFTENTVENLKKVQDRANKLRLLEAFSNAFGQIGSGIAGAMSGFKVQAAEPTKFLSEQADALESQFKERTAKEAEDPNSQYSASLRTFAKPFLKRMGVENAESLVEGMSGTQINKILPQVKDMYDANIRAEYMKSQKEYTQNYKLQSENTKRFDKMANDIIAEKASSRSTFGTDARTLAATQNIRLLLTPPGQKSLEQMTPEEKLDYEKNKDRYIQEQIDWLNGLDTREQYEVAKSLDRVLSQSGATITGTEKLTPKTLQGWISKAAEFLFNKRVGAKGASFMQRFENNLNREEEAAKSRVLNVQKRILAPHKDLKEKDPDKWKLVMRMNNLPEDPFEDKKAESTEDKDIRDLANRKFGGNYNTAKNWLISTGQLK